MTEAKNQDQTNNADAEADNAADDTALAAAANAGADKDSNKQDADKSDADKGGDADKGDKDADADKQPEGAPEKYDPAAFKMPEGVEFDQEGFEAVEPALRELNLSQDQAGKLMGAYAEKIVPMIAKRTTDAFDEQAATLRADLARELQADPEVGGKKYDESKAFAAKAIAHFIPNATERSEFSAFLNESGLGNQRHLMRVIAGAGRVLAEASTPASEKAATPLSNAEVFYGKKG